MKRGWLVVSKCSPHPSKLLEDEVHWLQTNERFDNISLHPNVGKPSCCALGQTSSESVLETSVKLVCRGRPI